MKAKFWLMVGLAFLMNACESKDSPSEKVQKKVDQIDDKIVTLDLAQANRLAGLPFKCLQNEYPNKTGQVLETASDLGSPKELHPAFYGCFDWHSSVHGHWSLVKLMKEFQELNNSEEILGKLKQNLSKENIEGEIKYFNRQQEYSFSRMYGWTWLLRLQSELDTWDSEDAKVLAQNLQPLTDLLVNRYQEFLPKLMYPIRVGTHNNSAFGMSFAYDYAIHSKNQQLKSAIEEAAKRLYKQDQDCPISWEPDGFDFLSPCLEEVTLMQRILSKKEFLNWLDVFMPQLKSPEFELEVAKVSDRTDGHLVHLDGLNFSRANVFYRLAKNFPTEYGHLKQEADKHMAHSLPSIVDGSYEGEHWLATFALYAMSER
jgi:hypothetical protein